MVRVTNSQSLEKALEMIGPLKNKRSTINLAALSKGWDRGEFKS